MLDSLLLSLVEAFVLEVLSLLKGGLLLDEIKLLRLFLEVLLGELRPCLSSSL